MNKKRKRCGATLILVLAMLLCLSTVVLYANAKELMDLAESTYEEAEALFIAAEIKQNQAEAAQQAAEEAQKAAKEAEPEQVIVVVEKEPEPVALSAETLEQPVTCVAEEPEPEQISLGSYTITAYCPCEICCGYWATTRPLDENGKPMVYTASGALAQAGVTIAVDPAVIPHGTSVWFEGPNGMQAYIAQDTGGAVKGNHIDLYFDTHEEALAWGSQTREVFREVAAP